MITIVDYGMGNLRNVKRACDEIGVSAQISEAAANIKDAAMVILPGVGAFGEAVRRIDRLGLRAPLLSHVAEGKPLLGICLGMQLLFDSSEENPGAKGLGVLQGTVKKFDHTLKVPHIGWNEVVAVTGSSMFSAGDRGKCFYFVHSFYTPEIPSTVAVTDYGISFSAAVQHKNVCGVQFHPEKSQDAGMALLRRWLGKE